jgi:hypothetical protein
MSGLSRDIEKFSARAQTWGSIASMGSSLFQAGGGFDGLKAFAQQPNKAPLPNTYEKPHAARIGF